MKRLLKLWYIVVSFSVLILLWYLLASVSSVGEALFPKPLTVGKALVDLFADGTMGANIGASLYRFAIGYVTSVVSAAILGLIIGWFKPLYQSYSTNHSSDCSSGLDALYCAVYWHWRRSRNCYHFSCRLFPCLTFYHFCCTQYRPCLFKGSKEFWN